MGICKLQTNQLAPPREPGSETAEGARKRTHTKRELQASISVRTAPLFLTFSAPVLQHPPAFPLARLLSGLPPQAVPLSLLAQLS